MPAPESLNPPPGASPAFYRGARVPGFPLKDTPMITLHDTFNDRLISRHRTLIAAVRAQRKHLSAVEKRNGKGAYLTYAFRENGTPVSADELMAAKQVVDSER